MNSAIDTLTAWFGAAQQWFYELIVQPLVFWAGQGGLAEVAFDATGWLIAGLMQLVFIVVVFGALQRWRPVEPVVDRATVRTDVLYTLLHRLGLFKLLLFFSVEPLFDSFFGALRVQGIGTLHVDQLLPGVTDLAWISFLMYLVIFDFVGYWVHRGQHQFNWWWKLHSLHHAQRQMTMWSDNRNHVLDSLLVDTTMVLVAQAIGVAPGQFMAVVLATQLSESFQHANVRLWFGTVGERLWVSPRFHRLHHAIGIGHETGGGKTMGGHNFGVLLPWWDVVFGTGNFEKRFEPTGVRDQLEQGRNYGAGFWQQQWLGLLRLMGKA